MIRKITIELVDHLDQRYNTVGDWQFERDEKGKAVALNVKVSDLEDPSYFVLIGLHETIEALLCDARGVKESAVDEFDLNWKPSHPYWSSPVTVSEPGEDYDAPYYAQHQVAVGIERILATHMWINWARYEAQVDQLIKSCEGHFAVKVEEPISATPERSPGAVEKDPNFDDDIPF